MQSELAMTQDRTDADGQGRRLWTTFLAGPVIYTAYFLIVWILGEFGCLAGLHRVPLLGANPIRLGVLVFTAVAALITLAVGIPGFRRWRRRQHGHAGDKEDDVTFMLFVGIWLNGLFTVVILLSAVPMLLGSACDYM